MTHVNAYEAELAEAEQALRAAKSVRNKAARALHEKRVELGLVEEPVAEEAEEQATEDVEAEKPSKKGKK